MQFDSIPFLLFFFAFFFGYWFVFQKKILWQNIFILGSSYFFYAWWDWRFLGLIFISSLTDYVIGRLLSKSSGKSKRKFLLGTSLVINLGILFTFKYYDFFASSLVALFEGTLLEPHEETIAFILPIGISFYTLQTLSYTIDVYRKKIPAEHNIITFFSYVSFFPQLVAGPIERAKNLLPQFSVPRVFAYEDGKIGMQLILWGLFKKVVVSDTLAPHVDTIFTSPLEQSTGTLLLGVVFFIFQLYGDFSGYSDMARGLARLLGFRLMMNFQYPFFSRSISEYWRRWHVSLTTWFRDYLYIPLGGGRVSKPRKLLNLFIVFAVSGLWHGAGMNFIVWGLVSFLAIVPSVFLKPPKFQDTVVAANRLLPSFTEVQQMLWAFILFSFPAIFFRSVTLEKSFEYLNTLFTNGSLSIPQHILIDIYVIFFVLIVEWHYRTQSHALHNPDSREGLWKKIFYVLLGILIAVHVDEQIETFMYFEF